MKKLILSLILLAIGLPAAATVTSLPVLTSHSYGNYKDLPSSAVNEYQTGTPFVHYKFNQATDAALVDYGSVACNLTPGGSTNPTCGIAGIGALTLGCDSPSGTSALFGSTVCTGTINIGTSDFEVVYWANQHTIVGLNPWLWLIHNPVTNGYMAQWYRDGNVLVTHFISSGGLTHETWCAKAECFDKLHATGPHKIVLQWPRSAAMSTMKIDGVDVVLTLPATPDYSAPNHALSELAAENITWTTARTMLAQGASGGELTMWEFWLSSGLIYK